MELRHEVRFERRNRRKVGVDVEHVAPRRGARSPRNESPAAVSRTRVAPSASSASPRLRARRSKCRPVRAPRRSPRPRAPLPPPRRAPEKLRGAPRKGERRLRLHEEERLRRRRGSKRSRAAPRPCATERSARARDDARVCRPTSADVEKRDARREQVVGPRFMVGRARCNCFWHANDAPRRVRTTLLESICSP